MKQSLALREDGCGMLALTFAESTVAFELVVVETLAFGKGLGGGVVHHEDLLASLNVFACADDHHVADECTMCVGCARVVGVRCVKPRPVEPLTSSLSCTRLVGQAKPLIWATAYTGNKSTTTASSTTGSFFSLKPPPSHTSR